MKAITDREVGQALRSLEHDAKRSASGRSAVDLGDQPCQVHLPSKVST
jgi:hypothetical protein